MRGDREPLVDILDAIGKIESKMEIGHEALLGDEVIQVWMVHHIQIIGEAAGNLSSELREAHPDLPWAEIISMRNLLVHQYFGIDAEEVWTSQ